MRHVQTDHDIVRRAEPGTMNRIASEMSNAQLAVWALILVLWFVAMVNIWFATTPEEEPYVGEPMTEVVR